MKIFYTIFVIIVFASNSYARDTYSGAPSKITDWRISCSVDKGSIIGNYPNYVFKTSKNRCTGGTYNQRAEIYTKKAITLSTKAKYDFQTIFTIKDVSKSFTLRAYPEKFDIFQIHDGRDGCAPPLKVNIQTSGLLRLFADYKTGPGEQCERDVIKSGFGKTVIKRDGTEYKLNVLLNFDGKSGFNVDVYLDDKLEVSGKYLPPTGNKYVASKYFYFKHGVYSKNMFDYEMKSKIHMKKVMNYIEPNPLKEAFNNLSKEERKNVQINLENEGFYSSKIDGYYGKNTEKGLKNFNSKFFDASDLKKSTNLDVLLTKLSKVVARQED